MPLSLDGPFSRRRLINELSDARGMAFMTTGTVFFVHSGTGTDSTNFGTRPSKPFATIDYAIGRCTASKGDTICVMPGHTETVSGAAGINLDVAGVSVVGYGHGPLRPLITLSAVGSTIAMGAANCRLDNLRITVSDDATIAIDINAAGCIVENCTMYNSASKEAVTWIDVNGGSANACDNTLIRNNEIRCPAVGTDRAIELGEVANNVQILDNTIDGDFGDACIHNITGKVLTKLRILRNDLQNTQSGDHAIELVSACTGTIAYNICNSTLAAVATKTAIDPGACFCIENYGSDGVGDVSGVLNPVADS